MKREDLAVVTFILIMSLCAWGYWETTFWVLRHLDITVSWR